MRIFQIEIARQCNFAKLAENDLRQSLQNMITHSPDIVVDISVEMNHFWYSAQALLVAVANISKLFWPPPARAKKGEDAEARREYEKTRQEDAKILREALHIDNSSPFKNRKLRDHFEHFDERIAKLPESDFNYHDTGIYGSNAVQDNNAIFMRMFDPDIYAIKYHGETPEEAAILELEPVMTAIKTLRDELNRKNPFLNFL